MAATGTGRRGDYVTYAPSGEKCVDCKQPIESLDRVWRVLVERPTGPPASAGYRHYEAEDCKKS